MDITKYIYLDNNATTSMPKEVLQAMIMWCNQGNPSAGYESAKKSRQMMEEFRKYIGELCGVDTCCPEDRDVEITRNIAKCDPNRYKIIFTSGASEGNSMVLNGVISAFAEAKGVVPHVIMGATEHKGLVQMAHSLEERNLATFTFIAPDAEGYTRPEDVGDAITPNTCLICVMSANNETGVINDVEEIGLIAHKSGIVYHCDTVQTFGKYPMRPLDEGVDSFCVSFHKFHGPPGVGVLAVKQKFLLGYDLPPIIFGTQNEGYRGGTENLPGIGAAFVATKYNYANRREKNAKLLTLKHTLVGKLAEIFPLRTYAEYLADDAGPEVEIILFSVGRRGSKLDIDPAKYLCNTLLLSVVKRSGDFICNSKLKEFLSANSIIVSVGSACNTSSSKASHVLYAMGADQYIRKGALRISFGDCNAVTDVDKFVSVFKRAVAAQM